LKGNAPPGRWKVIFPFLSRFRNHESIKSLPIRRDSVGFENFGENFLTNGSIRVRIQDILIGNSALPRGGFVFLPKTRDNFSTGGGTEGESRTSVNRAIEVIRTESKRTVVLANRDGEVGRGGFCRRIHTRADNSHGSLRVDDVCPLDLIMIESVGADFGAS